MKLLRCDSAWDRMSLPNNGDAEHVKRARLETMGGLLGQSQVPNKSKRVPKPKKEIAVTQEAGIHSASKFADGMAKKLKSLQPNLPF